jgi:hypothetical protein
MKETGKEDVYLNMEWWRGQDALAPTTRGVLKEQVIAVLSLGAKA